MSRVMPVASAGRQLLRMRATETALDSPQTHAVVGNKICGAFETSRALACCAAAINRMLRELFPPQLRYRSGQAG